MLLKYFENFTLSLTQLFKWHKAFKNHRVGIKEVAEDLSISYESTQQIFVNLLGMKRVNARLAPKY